MPMTTRGETQVLPLWALRMKCWSIFSVPSKLAITPSRMGRMATMLPGVRPSISFASFPTASTLLVTLLIATIEGSLSTTPRPLAYTSVLAVPRSMAKSLERSPEIKGKDMDTPQYWFLVDSNSATWISRKDYRIGWCLCKDNKDKQYLID